MQSLPSLYQSKLLVQQLLRQQHCCFRRRLSPPRNGCSFSSTDLGRTTMMPTGSGRSYSAPPLPEEMDDREDYNYDPVLRKQSIHKVPMIRKQLFPRGQEIRPTRTTSLSQRHDKTLDALVEQQQQDSSIETVSPTTITYTGGVEIPITSQLHIVMPREDTPRGIWPVFRLLDENGIFRNSHVDVGVVGGIHQPLQQQKHASTSDEQDRDLSILQSVLTELYPHLTDEVQRSRLLQAAKYEYQDTASTNTLLRAHCQMIRLREMDSILLNAQRQGRISFYMTCRGEEAIHMGAASALDNQDPIFAQYREQGLLMWRGFSLEQFTNQCFANDLDLGKGRQMPVHYGSRALNYHTVSSPLGTQLPQSVGAAYRLKLEGKPNVAICFFGEGAASTTDFHSALNFAATLKAPVIFFCRNNGYAISTPATEQYAGDGIISRAPGYGMAAIRVDGNDIFAVHAAVRDAKQYAMDKSQPVLIEAMTYRQGHHSTSDDSTRYRSSQEVDQFVHNQDPLTRLGNFLKRHDWMSSEEEAAIRNQEKIAILDAIKKAERRPKPSLEGLFEDVYHDMPPHLQEQQAKLKEHVAKYPKKYQ